MEISSAIKPGSHEKNINAQVTHTPWEDVYTVTHAKTPTKTWDSLCKCIMFHLQQVFQHDMGGTLKYYITNMLKKPI